MFEEGEVLEECPECNGEGVKDFFDEGTVMCDYCNGQSYVPHECIYEDEQE